MYYLVRLTVNGSLLNYRLSTVAAYVLWKYEILCAISTPISKEFQAENKRDIISLITNVDTCLINKALGTTKASLTNQWVLQKINECPCCFLVSLMS